VRRLIVIVALGLVATGCAAHASRPAHSSPHSPSAVSSAAGSAGLRVITRIPLPGGNSRFDYASLDSGRGLLFVAHLGASEVVEINIRTGRVVRTIGGLSQVHGVLVVPVLHRVYATATGTNLVVRIDEDTGRVLGKTATGAYDPASGHMLVDVQSRNQLAVIDPATRTVIRRVPLPGCEDDHGLALDGQARLAFIACDVNSALLTVDMTTWRVTGTAIVGVEPDVLAFDRRAGRLYVGAESGWVTILRRHGQRLRVIYSNYLADDAHVVAVDPATGRSYFPVLGASGGHPAVLVCEIT
jgi:DNA-binding beta-propeller fold protein YncE